MSEKILPPLPPLGTAPVSSLTLTAMDAQLLLDILATAQFPLDGAKSARLRRIWIKLVVIAQNDYFIGEIPTQEETNE